MLTQELINGIEEKYKVHFPNSKIFVNVYQSFGTSLHVLLFLAGDKTENSGNYWENDIFHISFSIGGYPEDYKLSKDIILNSNAPEGLTLENYHKSYHTKPTNQFCVYGSTGLSFRKTKGNAEKIIATLDKFFVQLKKSLTDDYIAGKIHDNHRALVCEKLGLYENE